jgi:hypothetical protein
VGARSKRTNTKLIAMLNRNLWKSFDIELSDKDIDWIEKRIIFLNEIASDAKNQYSVENVTSDIDLEFQHFFQIPEISEELSISPWLIRDSWLYYHDEGLGLDGRIRNTIFSIFNEESQDLYIQIINILKCIELVDLIASETDAVVVLTFMDYLATQMLHSIGRNRIRRVLQLPNTVAKYDMNKL